MRHSYLQAYCALAIMLLTAAPLFSDNNKSDVNLSEIFFQKAEILKKKNQLNEAITFYKKTIAEDPQHYIAYIQISYILKAQNKLDEATTYAQNAYAILPQNLDLAVYTAYLYHMQNKFHEAEFYYKKALQINQNSKAALRNLGKLYRQMELPEKSIPLYKKTLELNPHDENAHFGLGQAYLALGDFTHGLSELELGRTGYIKTIKKPLTDISQIKGSTILVPKGWGYGDMIQFCRWGQLIQEHGGTVLFHPHKPVAKILASCPYIDQITLERPPESDYDFEISIWSLSHLFDATEENIPSNIPYIFADPSLVYAWKKRLEDDKNFKIGLCWEGSSTLKYKDIALQTFAPIAHISGVSLYSLQKGHGGEQVNTASFKVTAFDDMDEHHGGFMDTAAIMKNVDLVITADTSVAHLAGAMGVPVWVLLPFGPDWRWMLKRTDTPWYPTMKLYRQAILDDWDSVIASMKKDLERILTIS